MRRWLEDLLLAAWCHKGLVSTLLLPFSWIYGLISQHHLAGQAQRAWRAPVPVVVIGNILLGGTGKTPVAQAVCQTLLAQGWKPGLISRGYGTRIGPKPHLSDGGGSASHLGDEPALLHAATGVPVAVHPNRSLAARHLLHTHPEVDVLIADDGLQHRALARDVEIAVQDGRGIGNGRLLPAGPLREPPGRLSNVQWIVTQLGSNEVQRTPTQQAGTAPMVALRLVPKQCRQLANGGHTLTWSQWRAQFPATECGAVAGIGHPERFFSMLRTQGVKLVQTLALPDHGTLNATHLNGFAASPILITAKDAVKCAHLDDARLWVVEVAAQFDDPSWLITLGAQLRRLQDRRTHKPGDRH
ncbi:MAG TPA: tetraacyldisaccharide 4'-kinase [Castellaniella sp.]|uniref:tetraacyldisaccharide 4'-kinase n=1 Tax=Castellaniella sp. TaxID=1955812 RepID=UPI002F0CE1E2